VGRRLFDEVGVAREDFVAVRDDALQRAFVGHRLGLFELELGRQLFYLGQAEETQHLNVAPADVEFVPLGRKLGRRTVGVVVVVQFFTANDDAPGRHIGAGVGAGIVAVA